MVEFRISDFFYPHQLLYWRRLLWKSQYYSAERVKTLQWKLLSNLLDHCFDKVPYYRNLSAETGLTRSDFRSISDLSKIPVLDKNTLLDYHEDFKADNFEHYRPREIHTSGTTGTPLIVYWDKGSNILELACVWRHFSWTGYKLGEPFLDIRSMPINNQAYSWNWKCRGLEISSDNIDISNIRDYAHLLQKYRIKMWRGHPAAIDSFCRLLEDAGIDEIRPRRLFTVAEALLSHQRNYIESWAKVPVCDSYGQREHSAFICQCPEGGYHIAPEYGIVEIIRNDGTSAQPGEEGRIIATGLHNRAFPLLRYDTGDYAIPSNRQCRCGRTLPLVESFTGRIDDRIQKTDGRWVSGFGFTFFHAKGIRTAQIVQKQPDAVDLYLVTEKNYSDETDIHLTGELKKKLGESMKVRIHKIGEVPFHSSGKFKFVVNKLNRE